MKSKLGEAVNYTLLDSAALFFSEEKGGDEMKKFFSYEALTVM